MNTRVIDDPSTVGWELDPDTGRWMWTGAGSGGGSAGAGMVIQPIEPTDPVTGLQWMDSTTGRIWIWDEDKWLEFPAGGSADAGGGGGAWELLETISGTGVSAFEFEFDPTQYIYLKFLIDLMRNPGNLQMQMMSNGSVIDSNTYQYENFTVSSSGSVQLQPGYSALNFPIQGNGGHRSILTEVTLGGLNKANGGNLTMTFNSASEKDVSSNERVTSGTGGGVLKTALDVTGAYFSMNPASTATGSITLIGLKRN